MKKPDLGSIKPTCGACDHWRLLEDDDGECCAMPAHAIIADDDDGRLLWPDVCHVVAPGVVEFRGQEIVV